MISQYDQQFGLGKTNERLSLVTLKKTSLR